MHYVDEATALLMVLIWVWRILSWGLKVYFTQNDVSPTDKWATLWIQALVIFSPFGTLWMERIPRTGLLSVPDIQTYSMEKCFSSSSSFCCLFFTSECVATVDVDWVKFFPVMRGLETSPQSTFTKWWIVNDRNINFGWTITLKAKHFTPH